MPAPRLSVVVASSAGGEFLFRCLESRQNQVERMRSELITVDRYGEAVRARVRSRHPSVGVEPFTGNVPYSSPVTQLRGTLVNPQDFTAFDEDRPRKLAMLAVCLIGIFGAIVGYYLALPLRTRS